MHTFRTCYRKLLKSLQQLNNIPPFDYETLVLLHKPLIFHKHITTHERV